MLSNQARSPSLPCFFSEATQFHVNKWEQRSENVSALLTSAHLSVLPLP